MADSQSGALGVLFDALKGNRSVAVTYARGASSVSLSATLGNSDHDSIDTQGNILSFHSQDFIFPAADLTFGAGAVEPAKGDTITYASRTYQVLSVGDGRCFSYMDPYRTGLRVHTKLIDE